MNSNNVRSIIKSFDERLGIEESRDKDFYLYVSTEKHRYYIGYLNVDEIKNKKDLMTFLECVCKGDINGKFKKK